MSTPVVSVVIAARDAETTIGACLQSLAAQTWTSHEVIVVNDGSTDRTATEAASHGVTVVHSSGVGASAARNIGISRAAGRVVAFTDADCTVPPTWLATLVTALDEAGATGAGGPQRNVFPGGGREGEAFDAFFRLASVVSDYTQSGGGVRQVQHVASCNSAYVTDALRAVGGFSEEFWPGEDVDLDLRLGARGATLVFVPDALVFHHRPGTMPWFRRMMRRYGAAERAIVRRHGRARRIDYLPAITVGLAVLHAGYLVPFLRPWLALFDTLVLASALAALMVTTPIRHWAAVVAFTVTAVWAWHVGWWRGRGAQS